ncbi:MAG: translation elongation factor-like protein [Candidatus Shapirobacteria bacterium]|nr:translation elongation factor-like protein [Candidatus Shapirobacteria bacterium]
MTDIKVGIVTHFYDKIGVAVINVLAPIKVGDRIKISGHDKEFEQEIASLQVEHQDIQTAKKGDAVGMKVDQSAKDGDEVYKVG